MNMNPRPKRKDTKVKMATVSRTKQASGRKGAREGAREGRG